MIGVLSLFGEMELQPVLVKLFEKHDIHFVRKNCATAVQLQLQLEESGKETDVVIINANAIFMEALPDLVADIRKVSERMRIVLILNGAAENYVRAQLLEYKELKLDVIFDNKGFDAEDLLNVVKQGKLAKHKPKERKVVKDGFDDSETEPKKEKEKLNAPKPKPPPKEHYTELARESFIKPQGHFSIGIMNLTRGAGATTTALTLARYFAMQNYDAALLELSGSQSLLRTKTKSITYLPNETDIESVKERYNVTVVDFGTPYSVMPSGNTFRLEQGYPVDTFSQFFACDLKLIMCFDEAWHIDKIKFIAENDAWQKQMDSSFLFLVPKNPEKVKMKYPQLNVYDRNGEYRENILEEFRREDK